MVSALTSRAVDHGFEHQWGQIKDFILGIVCFFVKQASVKSKNKDWLRMRLMYSSGAKCLLVDFCSVS
jgi:hypothetical protein